MLVDQFIAEVCVLAIVNGQNTVNVKQYFAVVVFVKLQQPRLQYVNLDCKPVLQIVNVVLEIVHRMVLVVVIVANLLSVPFLEVVLVRSVLG